MKHLLYVLFCIFAPLSFTVSAQTNLSVSNPHFNVNQRYSAIITDPIIEVTPSGAFAVVDFTFTINPPSGNTTYDSLEAVLKFDLPNNSYIHDSWLWLDANTIIRAAIVEKNRAVAIYEGIVKRRRDPSLLVKNSANNYQLSIYPMTVAYPRKVKISYSVPFTWANNKASIPLPINILGSSASLPGFILRTNYNSTYSNPSFSEKNISAYVVGNSGSQLTTVLNNSDYSGADILTLNYDVNLGNKPMLSTFTIGPNDNVYQLVIPSGAISNGSRNIVFILDHFTANAIYSFDQVKKMIQSSLLNDYNSTDSFNLFYADGNSIIKAFPSWQAIDAASVNNMISNLPYSYTNNGTQYESMLKMALSFAQSKPGANTQLVLLSNNTNYSTNQNTVDALFNNIKTYIGSFTNKINIINYTTASFYTSSGYLRGNELLYSKLSLASDGVSYKYQTMTQSYYSGKYVYSYDLNLTNCLNAIASGCGTQTNVYSISITGAGGFLYSRYTVNGTNKLNFNAPYVEIGKFSGSMPVGSSVQIQAIANGTMINNTYSISSILAGSSTDVKSWTYRYIETLAQQNNPALVKEIIDSSIHNRVLCYYTAFLALENGDTIGTNKNDNPNVTNIGFTQQKAAAHALKCYPNPFSDMLIIAYEYEATQIDIYDLTGRKVYTAQLNKNDRTFSWNGKDGNGNILAPGMYIVTLQCINERISVKVNKE